MISDLAMLRLAKMTGIDLSSNTLTSLSGKLNVAYMMNIKAGYLGSVANKINERQILILYEPASQFGLFRIPFNLMQ